MHVARANFAEKKRRRKIAVRQTHFLLQPYKGIKLLSSVAARAAAVRCRRRASFSPSPLAQQLLSKLIIFHFHTHWLAGSQAALAYYYYSHDAPLARAVVAESLFINTYISKRSLRQPKPSSLTDWRCNWFYSAPGSIPRGVSV
jgi:hypothetical protein